MCSNKILKIYNFSSPVNFFMGSGEKKEPPPPQHKTRWGFGSLYSDCWLKWIHSKFAVIQLKKSELRPVKIAGTCETWEKQVFLLYKPPCSFLTLPVVYLSPLGKSSPPLQKQRRVWSGERFFSAIGWWQNPLLLGVHNLWLSHLYPFCSELRTAQDKLPILWVVGSK